MLDVSRCKLLDAPADVLFAALTAGGVGHLTEQERARPLLQKIPPDLHLALVSEMAADQIEKASALMRRLRAPRDPR